jgi:hypothetical protein
MRNKRGPVLRSGNRTWNRASGVLGVAYDGFTYRGFVRKLKMERVNEAG